MTQLHMVEALMRMERERVEDRARVYWYLQNQKRRKGWFATLLTRLRRNARQHQTRAEELAWTK